MAATGFLALPKEEMATIIAACPGFQAATGADTATAAREYIHIYEETPPPDQEFYCFIGDHPEAGRFQRRGGGVGINNFVWTRGSTFAFLQHVNSFGEETAESFDNTVSTILEQILGLQSTASYRRIDEINPVRTDSGDLLIKFEIDHNGTPVYGYARFFTETFRTT